MIWAELSPVLSQITRLTDRQTDGQAPFSLLDRDACMHGSVKQTNLSMKFDNCTVFPWNSQLALIINIAVGRDKLNASTHHHMTAPFIRPTVYVQLNRPSNVTERASDDQCLGSFHDTIINFFSRVWELNRNEVRTIYAVVSFPLFHLQMSFFSSGRHFVVCRYLWVWWLCRCLLSCSAAC